MDVQHRKKCEGLLWDMLYERWMGQEKASWNTAKRLAELVSEPLDNSEGSVPEEEEHTLTSDYKGDYGYGNQCGFWW